jgi:rhamnosyltransferase subunit B
MKKIVISTFGSLGDIHPYLALGLELKKRGHEVTVATSDAHEIKILKTGLAYHRLRPSISFMGDLAKRAMDLEKGPEVVIKELMYPYIEQSYQDLFAITSKADLLINHSISFAGPIVAEKLNIPWVSCALSPIAYWSYLDPCVISVSPMLVNLPNKGRFINSLFINLAKAIVGNWSKPVYNLRARLGLPKGRDPIFYQPHSPYLSLSLFSANFATKQSDWPKNNLITGFCFFDEPEMVNNELLEFLNEGDSPILFTLGSAAVAAAGDFYDLCSDVVNDMGKRAILLVGENALSSQRSSALFITDYLPFSQIFPKASIIVNQSGIGTVAQVMRAGKPMLGIPFSHDQPDNAARIRRMGMGELIYKKELTKQRMKKTLVSMLHDQKYFDHAKSIGERINNENGITLACDAIETVLQL